MYLEKILSQHRQIARADARNLETLIETAKKSQPARGFAARIRTDSAKSSAVIAEIKRRSPSRGALNADLNPVDIAKDYEVGGASCISVLTDTDFFGGSPTDLSQARSSVGLPVLRKDFTVSLRDVCDTKIMNADCVLLIVAALSKSELEDFHSLATELKLDALVEVHDESELELAVEIGARMIGVNQRDLKTFEVDQKRAVRLSSKIPDGVIKVAESGIKSPDDARNLRRAGYDALLVGESLVTSDDIAKSVGELKV